MQEVQSFQENCAKKHKEQEKKIKKEIKLSRDFIAKRN